MPDLSNQDLSGIRIDNSDLSRARLHDVFMVGTKITGAWMEDVDISAGIQGRLLVNGVDVAPYVEAELDRMYPQRPLMRPADADGFRAAWVALQDLWPGTVARARALPPELLHERVDTEWSFIETLRHLVFVVDAWVKRAMLTDPDPYDPLDLPQTVSPDSPVPNDTAARPSLDEMLALRADRDAVVSGVLAGLTDAQLDETADTATNAGYPDVAQGPFVVRRCLGAVINEEWEHRLFAERDLAILESQLP